MNYHSEYEVVAENAEARWSMEKKAHHSRRTNRTLSLYHIDAAVDPNFGSDHAVCFSVSGLLPSSDECESLDLLNAFAHDNAYIVVVYLEVRWSLEVGPYHLVVPVIIVTRGPSHSSAFSKFWLESAYSQFLKRGSYKQQ